MKKVLVTGSCGLIGSEVTTYLTKRGWTVYGIDSNQRAVFFGEKGDINWNRLRLQELLKEKYIHNNIDIRDRHSVMTLVDEIRPNAIVHAAAQPSHDKAAEIPFADFETNAVGTLNMLEAARNYAPESVFVHLSTNKVYGDRPNRFELTETATRWEFAEPSLYQKGIKEDLSIDQSKHSLFGASKLAADILVQEYGRYFNMYTCCLRGGCLTGPQHSGVQLHGFLNYLIKCNLSATEYTIFGYKGKQVRDNIHAFDVARFIELFIGNPRVAEVYNIGGGFDNSTSVMEAIESVENISAKKMIFKYNEIERAGDHICYYSNLDKIKTHYPAWNVEINLEKIITDIVLAYKKSTNS